MRKLVKGLSRLLGGLVLLLVLVVAVTWGLSERRLHKVYSIDMGTPVVSSDAQAIERGEHIAAIRGCKDCHAADLGGHTIIDDVIVARLSGTNLTAAGPIARYSDADLVRAIRHGVAADGRPLLFMPAQEFAALSEQDVGDLLAYLHSLARVDRIQPTNRVGPLGRLLFLIGKIPLLPAEIVDHHSTVPSRPEVGPTAAYGAYLSSACKGCHGEGFSGGRVPGTPPEWPDAANLTPDASGLAHWTETDFRKALREGIARGGRAIDTRYMPVSATRHLTDEEVSALYAFLQGLPPRVKGQR